LEQRQVIVHYLLIKPQLNYFSRKLAKRHPVKQQSILFMTIDHNYVNLPYWFFGIFFQKRYFEYPFSPLMMRCRFSFTGQLWSQQIPIAEKALEQLRYYGTTTLKLPPGFGKTVLAAYLISQLEMLTLVTFHRVTLLEQWKNTFLQLTNAAIWSFRDSLPDRVNVILCMDGDLNHFPDEIAPCIGALVIDEAHAFCTPSHVSGLLKTHPRYIIALSATLERENDMHIMVQGLCGTHFVESQDYKPFQVIKINTGVEIDYPINRAGVPDWTKIVNEISQNEKRNNFIIELIRRNPGYKILVLTWRVNHARYLHGKLIELGEDCSILVGAMQSYTNARILIGSSSKIGTGFDEKMACPDYDGTRIQMLLLVGSTRSEAVLTQLVGRAFRSDFPIIVVFVDKGTIAERHWRIQKKWFLSKGGIISDYYL
jgi:superfamily II DNA or RNA helicase